MKLIIKTFDELNNRELYRILKSRSEIFVVEQTCIYQDLDDIDYEAYHFYYEQDGVIEAYLRAFYNKEHPEVLQVGRVLTLHHGQGLGGRLLKEALQWIDENLKPNCIYLEAQCYATGYYEREGFEICSEEFLEDGIPHVGMKRMK